MSVPPRGVRVLLWLLQYALWLVVLGATVGTFILQAGRIASFRYAGF